MPQKDCKGELRRISLADSPLAQSSPSWHQDLALKPQGILPSSRNLGLHAHFGEMSCTGSIKSMDDWITALGIRSQLGEVLTTCAWHSPGHKAFILPPEDLLPSQGAGGTVGAASSSSSTIGKARA